MDIYFLKFKIKFTFNSVIKLLAFLKINIKWVLDEGKCTINVNMCMQN